MELAVTEIMPLHSSLGNRARLPLKKNKKEKEKKDQTEVTEVIQER